MKKILIFISVLLFVCVMSFADVSVKQVAEGIEVTFLYPNPRASEVVVAGDFTNWQDGALPMTKTEKGWVLVKVVPAGTVMKYKFISDGNWTADIHAPDTVDDGFGGFNGLVDVDALLAASSQVTANTESTKSKSSKLHFQTWSMLEYQSKWDTCDEANDNASQFDLGSSGINLTSYLKVSGDALPGVPIYIEVALAEESSFDNLYSKGTTSLSEGLKNMVIDTLADPIYYYGGQSAAATYLGHLKLGLNTKYINYVSGYKYAKLPPHTNVNWITIDKEWEAGYSELGGFSQFDFSPLLYSLLDGTGITVNAVAAPNRSADRAGNQYGFYGYIDAQIGSNYIDAQYNGAYGTTYDTIFDEIMEDDFIIGYKGDYGPVTIKANGLYNLYGSEKAGSLKSYYTPSTSDVTAVDEDPANKLDSTAANVNVAFTADIFNGTVGYKMRGIQANMMYVEQGADSHTDITDQLGYRNSQTAWIDVNTKLAKMVTLGIKPALTMALNADKDFYYDTDSSYTDVDAKLVSVRPYFSLDLEPLLDMKGTIDGYAKNWYVTAKNEDITLRGDSNSQYILDEAGIKCSFTFDDPDLKGFELMYGLDNDDDDYLWNTVLMTIKLKNNITAEGGFGIRTANSGVSAPENPFGFYFAGSKKLSILSKPTVYIQFMYGMDPYHDFNDGPTAYNLDGYTLDDGVDDYNGSAALRIGLQWDI